MAYNQLPYDRDRPGLRARVPVAPVAAGMAAGGRSGLVHPKGAD